MAAPSFDLIEVIRVIQKQRRYIILVTAAAMALGALFFLVKKKKYRAEARFFVNNPLYGDRNTLFRSYETRYVDYFGGDDDLDKVTALAASDTVRDRIIRNCDFDKIYKFGDLNNDTAHAMYMATFDKNFNLKRTEYKDLIVSYIAYDPKTAAGVANMSVQVLEEIYRQYYTSMKEGMSKSIRDKKNQLDSAISSLTDTLAALREKFGIYGLISPTRQTQSSDVKIGGKGAGHAIEDIQNIESIKDQLVTDRAHYVSLLNEFSAASDGSMGYLKLITRALPPTGPYGPSFKMIVIEAGALGLFFSILFFLLFAYFQKIKALVHA